MTKSYDYIIIGAGSAGCVLAHRLSADPNNSVLLLEAGGDDSSFVYHMPMGFAVTLQNKVGIWDFHTVPQKNAANRKVTQPRGKVLGGSSCVNAMCYVRGNAKDYDEWASYGNVGWSYKDVLPYFKKAENQVRGESEYHGVGGPLSVDDLRYTHDLDPMFIESAVAAGHTKNDDFNGEVQEGVGYYQLTQIEGERCSTSVGYLNPVKGRANLEVRTHARVAKIIIEKGTAKGVELIKEDGTLEVMAKKEVLLCAGAFQSPQILLLSGVGPKDELKEHGIKSVKDLPGVGKNLHDHPAVFIGYSESTKLSLGLNARTPFKVLKGIFDYYTRRTGVLTSGYSVAGGFAKSSPELDRPDIQFHFIPLFPPPAEGEELLVKVPAHGFVLLAIQLNPKSRGTVTLASSDPKADPLIDPNYLGEEFDLDTLRKALKMAEDIFDQPPLKDHEKEKLAPDISIQNESQLNGYIRETVVTTYHPVGTCKMGNDKLAVVDDRLRVHGIKQLRVVDASVMPKVNSGNTNAPTIMIAEKGADMILEDNE